ncbi:MAG: adenylyl-sulfate kinase [Gammaproteobacteria bacterium]
MTSPTRFLIGTVLGEGFAGELIAGELEPGMELAVLPAGFTTTLTSAAAMDSKGEYKIILGESTRIAPGDILASANDRPQYADQFTAMISWQGDEPLYPGREFLLVACGGSSSASVSKLKYRLDRDDQQLAATTLRRGETGVVNLALKDPILFDTLASKLPTAQISIQDPETRTVLASGVIQHGLRRASNVHWQAMAVDKHSRAAIKQQTPRIIWLTGLSASGKSSIANRLEQLLLAKQRHAYLLDGDNIRHGLNKDLGFTEADRVENIRRVAETAKLMVDAGLIVITSFISPFRAERDMARTLFETGEFIEVHVHASLETCEQRDPKGLYKKARSGEIKNFTGFDSPYEPPENPQLRIDTEHTSIDDAAQTIMNYLEEH